ncbi:cupin domain-containing protein [Streptomyces sp. NBC_00212]|uniref:cupin domain-containing protein n=1 Tax=Streptomyces sp. NBC_00212 TaxID=2975684 RepID=UPI002F907DA6
MTLYAQTGSADHTDRSHLGTPEAADATRIGSNTARMLIPTDATGGQLGLFSLSLASKGPFASPHFHKEMTELFVVLSGEVQLLRGDEPVDAKAGSALYVPPGTPHGFANISDEPAELLVAFMPGNGREKFFYGLSDLLNRDVAPTEEELEEFAEQFDQYRYRS